MKCYVCKFVNQAAEARRHPNATTIETARLLYKRMKEYTKDRSPNKPARICETHRNPLKLNIMIDNAFKDLNHAMEIQALDRRVTK